MLELVGTKAAMSEKISFNVRLASLNSSESVFRGGVFFHSEKVSTLVLVFWLPKNNRVSGLNNLFSIYQLRVAGYVSVR